MIHSGVPLLILPWILASVQSQNSTVPTNVSSCNKMSDNSLTAYLGWPVLVSCKNLYNKIPNAIKFDIEGKLITCSILSLPSNEILSKTTMLDRGFVDTPIGLQELSRQLNVTDDLSTTYRAKLETDDVCWYQDIELNKTPIPSPDCNGFADLVKIEGVLNDTRKLNCEVPPFLTLVKEDLKWRWTFNCDETLPSNVPYHDGSIAAISKVNFENAGTYVCNVEYKGKELAVRGFDFCVKYRLKTNDPIDVRCPAEVRAQIGGTGTIFCTSDVSAGKANRLIIGGTWYREQNQTKQEFCDSVEGEITNGTTEGNRVLCSMESSIPEEEGDKCYKTRPANGQQHDKFTIKLTIKDLKPSDFGDYIFVQTHLAEEYNRSITLVVDDTSQRKSTIAGYSVGAALLLIIILVIAVCVCKKKDIKWYWKKHYGPYEKEFLTYTAYFAYYYDFERGESMKKTKCLVENLHAFMNKFGGTVYDDARNHNAHQFDVDNIAEVQGDCHRVILLITPEFLSDEWSRLKQHFALTKVVESGGKAIFITLPETNKAIEDLDDSSRTAIASAIKRNIEIKWDGKIPFNGKFKRRLEYALPKLPKPDYGRFLSDSSQAQLTHLNKYACKHDTASSGDYNNGFSSAV